MFNLIVAATTTYEQQRAPHNPETGLRDAHARYHPTLRATTRLNGTATSQW
ncbi:hypothetical protein FC50_GL000327 [Lacticaseibacillus pantheris DSM 15945 = JCM 12539 = NBRC 106106]|uniref:Uncharacterized protein n=1 Tax=Lacticaseibacillus pantheris DSM 15945 = JCM 12539 = NBRC 106106 TaxID=1423783 RepID=A0A0R1U5V5_9LACO|nr:hypothetical protein FC50_GL000327 [Lacticaseibacillus pantheris DSM 15945 = JCM 12539 = NBRC 106106]